MLSSVAATDGKGGNRLKLGNDLVSFNTVLTKTNKQTNEQTTTKTANISSTETEQWSHVIVVFLANKHKYCVNGQTTKTN